VRARDELCTVDDAAAHLQLHRKTVLRFIRDGKLPATKVGKSYRIRWADLDVLVGAPPAPASTAAERSRATAIVDVADVGPVLASKVASSVTNSLYSQSQRANQVHAEVVYDAERAQLKIVIVGEVEETADLLRFVKVWLEQLTP
jgi:excisionase family DNA binding protein